MDQQPVRWAEVLCPFAIVLQLNFLASQALAAPKAPLSAADISQSCAVAGALGGLVGGLAQISAICLAPEPADGRAVGRALIEATFSVVVGAIAASYLSQQVADFLPSIDASDHLSVGFGFGVFAWRAAPGLIGAIRLLTSPTLVKEAVLRMLNAAPRTGEQP